MWIEYNPNPTGKQVGDCSIRAIAKALDVDEDLYDNWNSLKEIPQFYWYEKEE